MKNLVSLVISIRKSLYRAICLCTFLAVILAILPIGLGFIDRLYFVKPEFTLLAPHEETPKVPIPVGTIPEQSETSPLVAGASIGSPAAPITMFIFSDFVCAVCQQFAVSVGKEIQETYVESGEVRVIFKYFISHSESSILAAQAGECAAIQNKFWTYHDLLMAKHPSETDISIPYLVQIALEADLDVNAFQADLESGIYREKVIQDDDEARELGVTGSPSYYINRMKGKGYQPFEAFRDVIEELLGKAAE